MKESCPQHFSYLYFQISDDVAMQDMHMKDFMELSSINHDGMRTITTILCGAIGGRGEQRS